MRLAPALRQAARLLSRRDRRLLCAITGLQMLLALLDLIGVFLLGMVGALAVTVVQDAPPPGIISGWADSLSLTEDMTGGNLVVLLASLASVILIGRSIVSATLLRGTLSLLARREVSASARLTDAVLHRPWIELSAQPSQQIAHALTSGVSALMVGVVGGAVLMATEVAVLVVLAVALLVIDPLVALASIGFFALVALAIQRFLHRWTGKAAREGVDARIEGMRAIQEAISVHRELTVLGRRVHYVGRVADLQERGARVAADQAFLIQVPKYVLELALVIGGFALAAVLFATKDAVAAVGTLALFLAAASRVMPALLRLQGASLEVAAAIAQAGPTLAILHHGVTPSSSSPAEEQNKAITQFAPAIRAKDVSVHYPGASHASLSDVTFRIDPGETVAIVGRSGAGKSTLADVVLGVLTPSRGTIEVGGLRADVVHGVYPGAVAYVPQEIVVVTGSVRDNVALGLPSDEVDDDAVWAALRQSHLDRWLDEQRDGLDTLVGQHGAAMSGGQRQRLGLARALYSRPTLLLLDEATSALDAETEASVIDALDRLEEGTTLLVIAHRLSTAQRADWVLLLDCGHLVAQGTFDEVKAQVPAFAEQARLLGI